MTLPLPGEFRRMTVRVGGVRINTLAGGTGSPYSCSTATRKPMSCGTTSPPRLAEDHTVVLTDLRGYGDSAKPPGGRHYRDVLAIWREYAATVDGRALPCGHYLPEEAPDQTTAALLDFFA
jgi:pimeloyl-ACP methyl ester carboxylesterase